MIDAARSALFDRAQAYAALGYRCVPVNVSLDQSGNKRVDTPQWRGRVFDQPSDWEGYTGIAINTGASGVVAVDIDVDTDKGKDGFAALADAGVELPDTPLKATSRSGGEHRLYRCGATPVKSSAGVLADNVDIRGDGGLLFVSPTAIIGHPEQRYEWHPGTSGVSTSELPEFPEELAQRLAIKQRRETPAPKWATPELVTPEQREWALSKIAFKLNDIANAGPGDRNRVLGQSVPRIIGLVKTIGEDVEVYAGKIHNAYLESGGDEDGQVVDWIASSTRYATSEDPRSWLPADRERMFWDARPELQQVRQAAFAGMASPWAVLGALCVRVLADVPPGWRTMTGIGDPAGGNLNLYAVLAAESGGGKGVASQVAGYLWPSGVYSVEIASGEALPKLFARRVKQPDSGEWVSERVRDSAIVDAPEFGSLSASGSRMGATLTQRLCNGFSGESLSFAVADESKNVEVLANSYRLGVITGVQYGNAGLLLSESAAVTGLPQRFVWFPANIGADELPEVRPDMPAPLRRWTFPTGLTQIAVCDQAKRDMEAAQRAKLIGDTSSPLDGHKLYARVKLAYALAVLNGHYSSVRDEDWKLSGVVMEVSEATRQKALDTMSRRDRKQAVAAGKRDGIRKAAASEVESDEAVRRAADSLYRWLQSQSAGASRNELRKRLRSDKREQFDDALDLLIEEGRVHDRGDDWYRTA